MLCNLHKLDRTQNYYTGVFGQTNDHFLQELTVDDVTIEMRLMDAIDYNCVTGLQINTQDMAPLYGKLVKTVSLENLPIGQIINEITYVVGREGYTPIRGRYRTLKGNIPIRYVYSANLESLMAEMFGKKSYVGVSDVLAELASEINHIDPYSDTSGYPDEDLLQYSYSSECLKSRLNVALDSIRFGKTDNIPWTTPLEIRNFSGFTEHYKSGPIPKSLIHGQLVRNPIVGFEYPGPVDFTPNQRQVLRTQTKDDLIFTIADALDNMFLTDIDITYVMVDGKPVDRNIVHAIDRYRHILPAHTDDELRCDMLACKIARELIIQEHQDVLPEATEMLNVRIVKTHNDEAFLELTAPSYSNIPFAVYYMDFVVSTFVSQSICFT